MALPKQSAFHRSTSASTLLQTAGLDCMDKLVLANTHIHTHTFSCIFCHSKQYAQRHNINMYVNNPLSHRTILFISACHTFPFECAYSTHSNGRAGRYFAGICLLFFFFCRASAISHQSVLPADINRATAELPLNDYENLCTLVSKPAHVELLDCGAVPRPRNVRIDHSALKNP